ncbi:hypothetical protein ACSBR1_006566 [Camellia fascicularis]
MQKRENLYWTGYAAHCIDLMLEDVGKKKSVAKVLDCAKVITCFIYNSNWVVVFMKRFTGDRELLRPVITHFAINFITLESIIKHKTALQDMFHSLEWKHSKWSKKDDAKEAKKIIQSKDFWTKAVDVLTVQEPLLKVLRLVDGDEKPTMGFIYEAMDRAKLAIKQNCRYYEPICFSINYSSPLAQANKLAALDFPNKFAGLNVDRHLCKSALSHGHEGCDDPRAELPAHMLNEVHRELALEPFASVLYTAAAALVVLHLLL